MKEMVYTKERSKFEVLDEGYENNVKYIIISLGTHPVAYLGIPLTHPLANKDYDNIPLSVHGGLTFGREGDGEYLPKDYFWYGWDYAHCDDYVGYYGNESEGKRWTTREIKNEVWLASYDFKKLIDLVEGIK